LLVAGATVVTAAEAPAPKIRDNLFLLEEAYNQEPGVIQHIQALRFDPEDGLWDYSFTEEWPMPTTATRSRSRCPSSSRTAGRPAWGTSWSTTVFRRTGREGPTGLAIAPRLSLVLPSGSAEDGTGRGGLGFQGNLPVSIELGDRFVAHLNGGFTVTPEAQSPNGREDATVGANAGAAIVWLALPWLNPLVETVFTSDEEVRDEGGTSRDEEVTINPGVRFAIEAPGDLQIVPGISMPVRVHPGDDVKWGVLFYLSFEHPWSSAAAARPD